MGSRNMYSGLVLVTLLGLLRTSEAAPDHGDHAAHNIELDSDGVETSAGGGEDAYYNYNNYYQDPAYQNYYYGEQYGSYPEQSAQSSELVSKQDDGGLFSALFSSVDRFFVGGAGLALPLAITLFAVDAVITGAFLMFPTTFEIPVVLGRSNSYSSETRSKRRRHQRSVPRHPGLCSEELETSAGVTGGMCRLMTSVLSSVDCLEVARCEVSQLAESTSFPTMASMVRPFVPSEVVTSFRGVDCSSVKCSQRRKFPWDQNDI